MSDPSSETPMKVSLSIPCRAEYVGVARLAILGVASRLNFSYDEVEDLRLAVGEACAGAVDCAAHSDGAAQPIHIECNIAASELSVAVQYQCGVGPAKPSDADPENIGALLMEILVDSVTVDTDGGGCTTITLTKSVHA